MRSARRSSLSHVATVAAEEEESPIDDFNSLPPSAIHSVPVSPQSPKARSSRPRKPATSSAATPSTNTAVLTNTHGEIFESMPNVSYASLQRLKEMQKEEEEIRPREEKTVEEVYPDLDVEKALLLSVVMEVKEIVKSPAKSPAKSPKKAVVEEKTALPVASFRNAPPLPLPRSHFVTEQAKPETEFILPEKYIQFEDSLQDETQAEYDMDDDDDCWLLLHNTQHATTPVTPFQFEQMMTALERAWQSLVHPMHPIKSQNASANASDEALCCICHKSDTHNSNAIVFCDGCNMAVHQDCYGIPHIPEGSYLCRVCLFASRPVHCQLCHQSGGAMKQTTTGQWCHLVCALWLEEVHVLNVVYQEPIDTRHVFKQRWRLKCCLCRQQAGAPVQCSYGNCYTAYHVTCAHKANLVMRMEERISFCPRHTPKDHPLQLDVFKETHATDAPVKQKSVAVSNKSIWQESQFTLGQTVHYTVMRRALIQANHGRWPLIPEYLLIQLYRQYHRQHPSLPMPVWMRVSRYWSLKREQRQGAPLLKLESIPERIKDDSIQVHDRRHQWIQLRQNLERLRMLLSLVQKREKMKLKRLQILQQIWQCHGNALYLELLEIWQFLSKLDSRKIFAEPVDPEQVPDYLQVVRQPMDLQTIHQKLMQYTSPEAFEADVLLMVENAKLYNEPDTIYYKAAEKLWQQSAPLRLALRGKWSQSLELGKVNRNGHLTVLKANWMQQIPLEDETPEDKNVPETRTAPPTVKPLSRSRQSSQNSNPVGVPVTAAAQRSRRHPENDITTKNISKSAPVTPAVPSQRSARRAVDMKQDEKEKVLVQESEKEVKLERRKSLKLEKDKEKESEVKHVKETKVKDQTKETKEMKETKVVTKEAKVEQSKETKVEQSSLKQKSILSYLKRPSTDKTASSSKKRKDNELVPSVVTEQQPIQRVSLIDATKELAVPSSPARNLQQMLKNVASHSFQHGDLVWAKMYGFPWFPAQVLSPVLVAEQAQKMEQGITEGLTLAVPSSDETLSPLPFPDTVPIDPSDSHLPKSRLLLVRFFDSNRRHRSWLWMSPLKLNRLGVDRQYDRMRLRAERQVLRAYKVAMSEWNNT